MELKNKLVEATCKALTSLYEADLDQDDVQIQETKEEFEGELTVIVFPFTRYSKDKPEATAEAIGEELLKDERLGVERYNVVKGFLNLRFKDEVWLDLLDKVNTPQYLNPFSSGSGQKLMVEFASPNTNKPLHLGHLRNIFLGYSVSRILEANGHDVEKVQIINDRGIHICRSMLAWQKFGEGETPESSGMKGDHLVGKYYVKFEEAYQQEVAELKEKGYSEEEAKEQAPILQEAREMLRKWEEGDEEMMALWRKLNGWVYEGFDATYERMGVEFDRLYYESQTYLKGKEIVMQGVKEGVFYEKADGSVWCDLSEEELDDKLLIRADGTAVYMTQDIGTAVQRYEDEPGLDGIIYTVGSEQEHHFQVLFKILEKLGYPWAKNCYHLSYGMVDLPTGKMKSREGTVVDADDLMEEMHETAKRNGEELGRVNELEEQERKTVFERVGIGGLKYHLLKVSPHKKILFDPESSIDLNGDTAAFIQYSFARIRSLFNKVVVKTEDIGNAEYNTAAYCSRDDFVSEVLKDEGLNEEEREVLFHLSRHPEAIKDSAQGYDPSLLTRYNFELVKAFNSLYQKHPIIIEEHGEKNIRLRYRRLGIAKAVQEVTERTMRLLGIDMVERM